MSEGKDEKRTGDAQGLLVSVGAWLEWLEFDEHVRSVNRHSGDALAYFSETMTQALKHVDSLARGSTFCRARIMPVGWQRWDGPYPATRNAMGAPPTGSVRGGRLNPDGIPYLYLSDRTETAIAEMRPQRQALLTVATWTLRRDLRVLDLTRGSVGASGDRLKVLGSAMSTPTHRDDQLAYVATQYWSEKLRAEGLDGIAYDSAMSPAGHNLALFRPDDAEPMSTELFEVTSVDVHAVKADITPPGIVAWGFDESE